MRLDIYGDIYAGLRFHLVSSCKVWNFLHLIKDFVFYVGLKICYLLLAAYLSKYNSLVVPVFDLSVWDDRNNSLQSL